MIMLALTLAAVPFSHAELPPLVRNDQIVAMPVLPSTAAPATSDTKSVGDVEVVRLARGYPSWSSQGSWQGWFDMLRSVRGLNNPRPGNVGRG